jgi:uncharacterized membrane protein
MAPDMQGVLRDILTNVVQSEGLANALQAGGGGSDGDAGGKSGSNGGGMSGMKGLAAGVGAAALAPVALKSAGKLARSLGVENLEDVVKSPGQALEGAKSSLGDRLTSSVKDKAKGAVDEAGGPGGIMKDAAKQMLPFGGGDGGGGKGGAEGVGKGRRMPVQQIVDIGIPIEAVYNQFTQFEDWPQFMHRVKRATQDDDCTVSFAVKIWGKTKEFTAKIETQRPDQRIKWKSSEGMTHTGVVTFHEVGPNLTRVILNFEVDPGSLVEKFARGARHVKRAARADLHRFVAFIETAENETGAWRGVIEDGELVEEHDPSYDEQREYSDIEELTDQEDSDEDDEGGEDERGDDQADGDEQSGDEEESPQARRAPRQQRSRSSGRQQRDSSGDDQQRRSGSRAQSSSSGRSSSGRSSSGRSSSGRSSSGRSSSGGSSSGRSSSGGSQARSRSSRQSSSGGSSSSRSGSGSRSSRGSSSGQSRSRSQSQSRKS